MAHVQKRCCSCAKTVPPKLNACPACGGKDLTWRGRYRAPDGYEKSRSFDRKSDAERWLVGIESSKHRGDWLDPAAGRMSFEAFAAEWLAGARHLRASTLNRYESLLRRHILPAVGTARLNAIRPQDIRSLVSDLLVRGLSPTTVRHAVVLCSEILRAAQIDGRLARNPATGVSLPTRPRLEQRFLSAEELWRLAGAIGTEYRALVLTGGYAGLRWGELVGLRVGRLRLLERKIDVVESIVEVGGHLVPGLPKTGPRTISIPTPLVEEISLHLAVHPAGKADLVFGAPAGGPLLHPNFYRRAWKPALERAGLDPKLRIHDLRHTAVALGISAGAHAKEIQELCGHSSIATTFNVYGHLLPNLSERLADRLGELFLQAAARPQDVAN